MGLIYGELVTNRVDFEKKVKQISVNLKIDPNWLMAVMYLESTLIHTSVNSKTNATGLIQFMPNVAIELGTTVSQLRGMTNLQQLNFVEKYLKRYSSKIKSFIDCYFAVFFPAAIGRYSDYVLQTHGLSAALVAQANSGYDLNKDNEITYREVETKILAAISPEYRPILRAENVPTGSSFNIEKILKILISLVLFSLGSFIIYKEFSK
jgi:hypothetical protein